jgi:hypothetical protein
MKYQIAAATTTASRMTHHQFAIPPAGVVVAPPGAVLGAVVCASAHEDVMTRSIKPARVLNEAWRISPPLGVSEVGLKERP